MTLNEYFSEEPKGAKKEMADYLGVSQTWLSLLINGRQIRSIYAEEISTVLLRMPWRMRMSQMHVLVWYTSYSNVCSMEYEWTPSLSIMM